MHPNDMAKLGLQKGDKVRMLSDNGGEAVVAVKTQKGADSIPGLVFMAYGPISSRFMEADTAGTGMPISKHMPITIEGPLAEDGSVMEVAASLMARRLQVSPPARCLLFKSICSTISMQHH